MFRSMHLVKTLAAICLFAVFLGHADAQQITAQIKGTITDATGAVVPDSQVAATNTQTGVSTTVTSDAKGNFQFLQLPVGTYKVTVSKSGFTNFTENGILLTLNQIYNLPVTLQVAALSQTVVEVQANPAQVETTTTQMDTVIEGSRIVDLPLIGRNWTQLQQLVPGVVSSSDRFTSNYATNGSESQQNSFLVNGVDDIDINLNSPSVIPNADAIAEFNLIESSINPEYGRNSGGILNAVIKSGTNQFHGDAFEFYRDTFLNGRNIYQASKPVFHQNQFGGTVGGPVWKNHTFFFLAYQGNRFRQPEPSAATQTTVFTNAQRSGIFSNLSSSKGKSPMPLVGDNGALYPAGTPYSTIFSGGYVPTADLNPVAQKLLSYVPAPNTGSNIYSFNPIRAGKYNQGIARLDHTFSPHDSMWVTTTFEHDPFTDTVPFPPYGSTLPGFASQSTASYKFLTGDWSHTFNSNTLNDFRVSYLRFNYETLEPVNSVSPSTLGFTGITPQNTAGQSIPFVSLTGYFNLGFTEFGPQPRLDQTYELIDSLSRVIGNHTIKFGFDGKRYNVFNPYYNDNNGSYTFGGAGPYSTGDPGADFLLGIPDSYLQGSGGVINARTFEYYAYFQDSWKVNNNLTINYGAGYQIDTPLVNRSFNSSDSNCFIPGQQSTIFPTAPAGLLFPGDKNCSASGYYPHYDHVAPRFGFAYSPGSGSDKKSVIRGGFGIYFNRSEEELALQDLGALPYSLLSYGNSAGPSFANPFRNIATGATVPNPFPFAPPAKGSKVDFTQFEPFSINVVSPNFTSPYAMNYNLNIQRQLPGAMIFQLAFVGSQGRHLEMVYEGNPISPAGQAACAADPACVADRLNQHQDYPTHAEFAPGDIFGSVGIQATAGVSSYNSLQASLKKNLNHGLSFLASYTWSHSIDDTSGYESGGDGYRALNPYNFALNKGDSAYDARQRFVINYDYEIPHLSRLWNNTLVRTTLDGWHIAGITTLQTGFPILIADSGFRSLTCDQYSYYGCWDAPNNVTDPTTYDPRNAYLVNATKGGKTLRNYYYFNPNSFALEPFGTTGNEGRNNFHGPGINNTDLVLSKRIYLTNQEQRYLELRLEGYNVFNHTQFTPVGITMRGNGVNGDINSSNFGRVLNAATGRTIQLAAKFYF